jgi:uncharacterized membrane protein (DUF4010 family)
MDNFEIPFKVLLGFILGGVIGLEREINEKKDLITSKGKFNTAILGLRTFSLVGGLGSLAGFLYFERLIFFVILSVAFIALLLTFYILDSIRTKDYGVTTEFALLFSFLIGFLLTVGTFPIQLTLAITIILVLLLSRKEEIKDIVEDIRSREINAFISFAVLTFVILPFLPNQTYSLSDFKGLESFLINIGFDLERFLNLELFNPFKLWFILVLITGVDIAGYILEKTIGQKKGWIITSLAGGFVSSTATTVGIARASKGSSNLSILLASAFLANAISFVPIALLLGSLNPIFLVNALPFLIVLFVGLSLIGGFYLFNSRNEKQKVSSQTKGHQIFNLTSALKFVSLYLVISIISKLGLELFGNSGFLLASAIGGLTGIDAVVINTASLAGNRIDFNLAIWTLVLVNGINLLAKSAYSFLQGSPKFALQFLIGVLLVIALSVGVAIVF